MQRTYSWTESTAINKGTSWKERVRVDVETCRRVAENWEEFIQIMSDQGYKISEKKHTTYTSPDNHVVRAGTLGSPYTRESLEMYWAIRDNVKERFKEDFNSNYEPVLSDFVTHYDGNLSVKIPLGPQYLEHRQFAFMPLNKDTKANEEALRSYMRMDELYDICDENGVPVMAASGIEILRSIEDLRDEERMRYREYMRMEEEEMREDRRRREAAKEEEEEKNKQYYSQKKFRSSRSGMRYRCSLYDENGRRRSIIELILLLAIVVLTKEAHVWVHREGVPKEQANEIFFATPNDKMQLIVDSVDLARQEAIDTPAQLDKRLDIVGAEYSRTKKAYNNTSRAAARMEPLANAINTYKKTKKIAEGIDALPEGDEKNEMIAKYKDVIEEYKAAKHVMYVNKVVSEEAIIDFDLRYYKITQDAKELEARLKDNAEHYKRLKKLEYSLQLAEDPNFIYGPSYPGVGFKFKDDEEAKTYKPLWHKLEEEKEKAKESAPEPGENAAREDEKEAEKV